MVYLFFVAVFVAAVMFGVVFSGEFSQEGEKSSIIAKYPLLGLVCWFVLLGIAYWMLQMTERNIWCTYFGFLECALVIVATVFVCKKIRMHSKQKKEVN